MLVCAQFLGASKHTYPVFSHMNTSLIPYFSCCAPNQISKLYISDMVYGILIWGGIDRPSDGPSESCFWNKSKGIEKIMHVFLIFRFKKKKKKKKAWLYDNRYIYNMAPIFLLF